MKFSFKKLALSVILVYIIVSCYTFYYFMQSALYDDALYANQSRLRDVIVFDMPSGEKIQWILPGYHQDKPEFDKTGVPHGHNTQLANATSYLQQKVVDIFGKAAIGFYLWQHIFEGHLKTKSKYWKYGQMHIKNITFRFHTGPGIVPDTIPPDATNVVLVLNGREPAKVDFARQWLDYIGGRWDIVNVAVVLLGNELCNNTWIRHYMSPAGGAVKLVFLVYDSPDIDDHYFFQWPLGVATYRSFPFVAPEKLRLDEPRRLRCNFLGTVYPNSSRETLLRVLRGDQPVAGCYVKARRRWEAQETEKSLTAYIEALRNSDLTLNPVGLNTECYRIYEALSYGSVPVVEDRPTAGSCGLAQGFDERREMLRLLKRHAAPILYVADWTELRDLMNAEARRPVSEVVERRRAVVEWYTGFRRKMRDLFIDMIDERFFRAITIR